MGLFAVLAVPGALACNVDTTGTPPQLVPHCATIEGDDACRSAYADRPFCNSCVPASQYQGCVATPPAPSCSPTGGTAVDTGIDPSDTSGSEGSSGSSSSTTAVADSSTTAVADSSGSSGSTTAVVPSSCSEEGLLDEDCDAGDPARPYCIDATCSPCDVAGGDAFCGQLDGRTPWCNVDSGRCEGCDAAAPDFCPAAQPVCSATGACAPCDEHAQCETACHIAPTDPLQGECFEPDAVVYVAANAACPGMGTMADPACSLADVVAAVPADAAVAVMVQGGVSYAEHVVMTQGTVALIGSGLTQITGEAGLDAPDLEVQGGILYVDGIRIRANTQSHGVACGDATLWLDDSEVRNNIDYGIYGTGPCDLTLRRSAVHNNPGGGIRQLGGVLRLENAAVVENGDGTHGPGVNLQYAEVHALYSTIAGNDGVGDDSLQCLASTGDVRNSIVTGLAEGSIDLDCFVLDFSTNAIDTNNFVGADSVLVGAYDANMFVNPNEGDMRLDDPPTSPFGGVALWLLGDPPLDIDGTARPMGGEVGYAGVDEP